jgi:hypothetical protein
MIVPAHVSFCLFQIKSSSSLTGNGEHEPEAIYDGARHDAETSPQLSNKSVMMGRKPQPGGAEALRGLWYYRVRMRDLAVEALQAGSLQIGTKQLRSCTGVPLSNNRAGGCSEVAGSKS